MRYTREDFDQAMRMVHYVDDQVNERANERSYLRLTIRIFESLDWLGTRSLLGRLVQGHKNEARRRLELTTFQPEPFYEND